MPQNAAQSCPKHEFFEAKNSSFCEVKFATY